MIKVSNSAIIRKLSLRSFAANKTRNIIAILAIALTSILFTSVFTVIISLNYSWEQQTMRMSGGSAHGAFKYLTDEQVEKLKVHPLIKKYGTSLILSMPEEAPFNKHHTEIRFGDENLAAMFFSSPTTGRMPLDKNELATDTTVLDLLGIPHELGQEIKLTYPLGDKKITDTFKLCGFWEADGMLGASQIWLNRDYVEDKLKSYSRINKKDIIGSWSLNIMFSGSGRILENLYMVAADNGYEIQDESKSNYLDSGVNWAYTATHLNSGDKIATLIALAILLLLIIFSGYLIIYNIFSISVMNDIRFFGLLKTIGTTPKQIKRVIRYQALILSIIGIPLGLLIGFLIGNSLSEIIMSITMYKNSYITYNPLIFVGSAVFSLITVFLSCSKPGRLAGSVSPIEAVRYTESSKSGAMKTKKSKPSSVLRMALANLARSKKKTVFVLLSLSLSVLLLSGAYSFAQGFDMNKYIKKFVVTDFIIGHSDYFQDRYGTKQQNVSESVMSEFNEQPGIREKGRVYTYNGILSTAVDVETYKKLLWRIWDLNGGYLPPPESDGKYKVDIDLLGLEELPLDKLVLLEGDLGKLESGEKDYIIQLVTSDDYGKPQMQGAVYNIGDKIKFTLSNDYQYSDKGVLTINSSFTKEYEVAATALIPNKMTKRRFGYPIFALPASKFIHDTKTSDTMIYMANVEDQFSDKIEDFISDYTSKIEPSMDYESRLSMSKEFELFRYMFLFAGGALGGIVGIIGLLNFANTVLTSIITRQREFAMLQSIGMTGRQLKGMLIWEGLFLTVVSTVVSLVLSSISGLLIFKQLENILWFFTFKFDIAPFLLIIPLFIIIGVAVPVISYRMLIKHSIVERLRMVE